MRLSLEWRCVATLVYFQMESCADFDEDNGEPTTDDAGDSGKIPLFLAGRVGFNPIPLDLLAPAFWHETCVTRYSKAWISSATWHLLSQSVHLFEQRIWLAHWAPFLVWCVSYWCLHKAYGKLLALSPRDLQCFILPSSPFFNLLLQFRCGRARIFILSLTITSWWFGLVA